MPKHILVPLLDLEASVVLSLFARMIAVIAIATVTVPVGATVDEQYRDFALHQKRIISGAYPAQETVRQISIAYRSAMGIATHSSLTRLSIPDLLLYLRAADEASFYTSAPDHAMDMENIVRALAQRGAATPEHLTKTYFSLIAAREYTRARQWRMENNLVLASHQHEPATAAPGEPKSGYLMLTADGLSYRPFALPAGGYVLVVAHPQCHFSVNAIAAIYSDETLLKAISGRSIWMTPQHREANLEAFHAWNTSYTQTPIGQMYSGVAWPSIDSWETPTFYFFRDGVLKEKISGWPSEGRRAELYRALRAVGILGGAGK